jgi:hypothetical protein
LSIDEDLEIRLGPSAKPRFSSLRYNPLSLEVGGTYRVLGRASSPHSMPLACRRRRGTSGRGECALGNDDGLVVGEHLEPRRASTRVECVIDKLQWNGLLNEKGLLAIGIDVVLHCA